MLQILCIIVVEIFRNLAILAHPNYEMLNYKKELFYLSVINSLLIFACDEELYFSLFSSEYLKIVS